MWIGVRIALDRLNLDVFPADLGNDVGVFVFDADYIDRRGGGASSQNGREHCRKKELFHFRVSSQECCHEGSAKAGALEPAGRDQMERLDHGKRASLWSKRPIARDGGALLCYMLSGGKSKRDLISFRGSDRDISVR